MHCFKDPQDWNPRTYSGAKFVTNPDVALQFRTWQSTHPQLQEKKKKMVSLLACVAKLDADEPHLDVRTSQTRNLS